MHYNNEYPWAAIHEFLLECGRAASPSEFASKTLNGIKRIINYDQGRVYSFNANNTEVVEDVLLHVDEKWPTTYYNYYSRILDGKYGLSDKTMQLADMQIPETKTGVLFDWTYRDNDEFVADYIRPQGIRFTLAFGLFDANSACRRAFMFDRTGRSGFSEKEINTLSLLIPHLENLHRLFYIDTDMDCPIGKMGSRESLTARETEIANLIGKGFSPERIAKELFITRATVYKHVAHIHAKLGVSSRQELVVKLLHSKTQRAAMQA